MQARLTPKISAQAEVRRREVSQGNLDAFFEPSGFDVQRSRDFRREADSDSYRAGLHFQPTPASDLIASFIYQDSDVELGRSGQVPTRRDAQAYIAETQYVMKHSIFDIVLGGGYYGLDLRIPTESPEDLVTDHGNAMSTPYSVPAVCYLARRLERRLA